MYYALAFDIVDMNLGALGNSTIEFINLPANVVKLVMTGVAKTFSHLNDVCDWIGGYVDAAKMEVNFENTRLLLHEIACREYHHFFELLVVMLQLCLTISISPLGPPIDGLVKGMGCDGLDNNCDPLKKIDECAEDIYVSRFTDCYLLSLACSSSNFPLRLFCSPQILTSKRRTRIAALITTSSRL